MMTENALSLSSSLRSPWARIAGVLSLAALCSGCVCGETGSGNVEERTQSFSPFDSVVLGDGFHGEIHIADEYSVTVLADDNLIDDVRVRKEGDELTVDMGDTNYRNATLEVIVTMPELSSLSLNDGSSFYGNAIPVGDTLELTAEDGSHLEMSTKAGVEAEELVITAKDGSSIDVVAFAKQTDATLSDGSHVVLSGAGALLVVEVKDGSSLDTQAFPVQNFSCDIRDGSHVEASVSTEARGTVKDGSSLEIDGDPEMNVEAKDGSSVSKG